jgi:uncharacterized protein (TIGR03067 family)
MQIVKDGNKREPLRFELDATKSPRTLDLYMMVGDKEKGPIKGIYALEGDTLKICYAQLPGDERPKTFASPPKSRTYYISLKRAK